MTRSPGVTGRAAARRYARWRFLRCDRSFVSARSALATCSGARLDGARIPDDLQLGALKLFSTWAPPVLLRDGRRTYVWEVTAGETPTTVSRRVKGEVWRGRASCPLQYEGRFGGRLVPPPTRRRL